MAFVSQELKAKLAPSIKKILAKYKMKGSLSVHNHSTLVLTLKEGPLDIIGNYNAQITQRNTTGSLNLVKGNMRVNEYWLKDHYTGTVLKFLQEVSAAMNVGNHDNSEIQVDYFDVGWYTDISVGKWNKDYVLTANPAKSVATKTVNLKPNQCVRIILNGISFRTTISELDNCMDHLSQRQAVDSAIAEMKKLGGIGIVMQVGQFNVQIDLV